MKKLLFILFTLVITFSGCNQNKNAKTIGDRNTADSMNIKYAKGFKVTSSENYKLVDITDPSGESDMHYKYALLNRGGSKDGIPADYQIIEIPIRSVICMTTLQLSNFIKLKALDKVVWITSTRFLFNEQMNKQLKEGKTSKIGIEGEFDNEAILALNPDIILVSPFKKGGYDAIRNLDIPGFESHHIPLF